MPSWRQWALGLGLAIATACKSAAVPTPPPAHTAAAAPTAPVAPREPVTAVLHGVTLVDAYAWLRDRDDPRTRAYLDAENAFTEAVLLDGAGLRQRIAAELRARVLDDDHDVPVRHGPFEYTTRTIKGGEYWQVQRTPIAGGAAQVVLDANVRAQGHDYFGVASFELSPDHQRLAWGEDTRGDERLRIFVIDVATGKAIDAFEDAAGPSMTWSADSRTLWHTRLDDAHREYQLWRRVPGDASAPVLAHEEPDPRFSVGVERSRDDAWLQLVIASAVTSEVRVMDARRPASLSVLGLDFVLTALMFGD